MIKARIISYEPLEPIIIDHVLDESIKKRGIPLKDLPREDCGKILEKRLIISKILDENTRLYLKLRGGMPKRLRANEVIYYKKDSSSEYPYIYVVKRHIKELKERMISIYWLCQFEERGLCNLREIVNLNSE